jgi:dethiobiotin synthetase
VRVVILGTGTNVGKTYVTACLARGAASRARVLALKPIESGVDRGVAGDAGAIAEAAGHSPRLSPWRFPRPVSPHIGARALGLSLNLSEVADWVQTEEARAAAEVVLIELAGGAFSPLGSGLTNADLAAALGPALWLLVAPDSLGVLHDVTATLRALSRRPDAVVLSGARPSDESSGTNATELSRLGITDVLEVVPPGVTNCPTTVEWLLQQPHR